MEKPNSYILLERAELTTMMAVMTEEQGGSAGYTTSYDGVADPAPNSGVDWSEAMSLRPSM